MTYLCCNVAPLAHAAQDVDISASSKASVPLIQLIMRQIYNLVIEDPNKLNDYRGFSEEVWCIFRHSTGISIILFLTLVRKVPNSSLVIRLEL
jgi:hypothetical protein